MSGRLTRGIAWAPDSKRLSYIETKGWGKVAKTELWAMEVATGERSLLLSAEKLESVLPAPPSRHQQATARDDRLLSSINGRQELMLYFLKCLMPLSGSI